MSPFPAVVPDRSSGLIAPRWPCPAAEDGRLWIVRLRLDDGTVVGALRQPSQGIKNMVLLGVEEASGRHVAVKIELTEGAVERERRALTWLAERGGPSPRVVTAARVVGDEYGGAPCLVSDRVVGEPPTTVDGWSRLGTALARLSEVQWQGGDDLPTLDHGEFLALHSSRVDDLAEALGRDLTEALPAVPPSYFGSPLILTHGDPGPGNFLDDGVEGTLIDWEDAQVAPRGLDLGRAIFIAYLGSGPAGYVATELGARAAAVKTGFVHNAKDWSPTKAELAWWFGVAGVQFAHLRYQRKGHPGVPPWLDAVGVLEAKRP